MVDESTEEYIEESLNIEDEDLSETFSYDDKMSWVKSKLQDYLNDSINGTGDDEITEGRVEALKRYYGEPNGTEVEGRSTFVTSECRDAVLWALPSLLNVFLTAEKIAEFMPSQMQAVDQAQQMTDYINYLVLQENPAFKIFTTWFWDALVTKTGFVKYYYDEQEETTNEEYAGLTEMEAQHVLSGVDITVNNMVRDERSVVVQTPQGPLEQPVPFYNLSIQRTTRKKKYVIENIAPENVITHSMATSIDDAKFVALVYKKTRSELVEMGYTDEFIDTLPTVSSEPWTDEGVVRDDVNLKEDYVSNIDYYELLECYAYVDENEDGVDELHRILCCGRDTLEIMDDEEVDEIPIAAISPFPKPYSLYGMGLVENLIDIQNINTALWRNCLDYLYTTVQPQWEIVDRNIVNKEDIQKRTPGGFVRTKQLGSIQPIANPPLNTEFFSFLDRIDAKRDMRSGVTPLNSGLDKDALRSNVASNNVELSAAGRQLQDFIARSFAETGVKKLFRGLQKLVTKYQDVPTIVRLRGQFIEIDPRTWKYPVDISVNVGLGTGTAKQKSADIQQILALQLQLMPYGVANSQNIYHALAKLLEVSGYKDIQNWATDPSTLPPPEPKPTLEEIEAQKVQLDYQAKMAKINQDKYETDVKAQVDMSKIAVDAALKDKAIKEKVAVAGKDRRVDFFPGVKDK